MYRVGGGGGVGGGGHTLVGNVESGAIVDQVDTLVRRSGEAW